MQLGSLKETAIKGLVKGKRTLLRLEIQCSEETGNKVTWEDHS